MPLNLESKIKESLASQGATFVCFVDLSSLPEAMTLGFPRAILFGIPLPHKTIARIAGLGRIGKNNLLINDRYGCALSMCSVLTDAPLDTNMLLSLPESASCGSCTICIDACKTSALRGNTWLPDRDRDEIINTQACTTCLLCMVLCPWSIKYMKQKLS